MKLIVYALFPVALLVAACGGGGSSVDIVGDPPDQQAEAIADAICDQQVECGEATVDCTFNQETQMNECVGTIEDVEYDACVAETEPEILATLEGCELTAEEEQLVEDCINDQTAQSCITQAELDAYAAELEAGNEPEELRPPPAACEQAFAILEACTPQ